MKSCLRKEDGEQVPATGVFVSFPDGLAGMIDAVGGYAAERLRGKLYDQLIPASLPLHDYADWRDRFPLPEPPPSPLQLAVVIAGGAGAQQTLSTLGDANPRKLDRWCDRRSAARGRQRCLAGVSRGRRIRCAPCCCDHGKRIFSNKTLWPASPLHSTPIPRLSQCTAISTFSLMTATSGRFLSGVRFQKNSQQGYCAHLFAVKRDVLIAAMEARPDNLYRLFNCLLDQAGPLQPKILHLPGTLATVPKLNRAKASSLLSAASHMHLRARGIEAEVTEQQGNLFPMVRLRRPSATESG